MADDPPGPLLAEGRAADVFDLGDGRVLRRYRTDHDAGPEATVMAHVARHGYPVPAVHDADGRDLVMDRVDGPTMLDRLTSRPWEIRRHAHCLAALQRHLSEVPLGDLVLRERVGPGTAIVHGDHHPDNVILSPDGPVVIDWTNACRGPVGADVATTWCLIHAAEAPVSSRVERALVAGARGLLLRSFLAASDRPAAVIAMPAVVELRLTDPNLSDGEKRRMVDLLDSVCRA